MLSFQLCVTVSKHAGHFPAGRDFYPWREVKTLLITFSFLSYKICLKIWLKTAHLNKMSKTMKVFTNPRSTGLPTRSDITSYIYSNNRSCNDHIGIFCQRKEPELNLFNSFFFLANIYPPAESKNCYLKFHSKYHGSSIAVGSVSRWDFIYNAFSLVVTIAAWI